MYGSETVLTSSNLFYIAKYILFDEFICHTVQCALLLLNVINVCKQKFN